MSIGVSHERLTFPNLCLDSHEYFIRLISGKFNSKKLSPPLSNLKRPVPEHAVYIYESAGISEHKENVPIWLWIVVVALVTWGIYIWSPIGMLPLPRFKEALIYSIRSG